jgi:hypothetical protein
MPNVWDGPEVKVWLIPYATMDFGHGPVPIHNEMLLCEAHEPAMENLKLAFAEGN